MQPNEISIVRTETRMRTNLFDLMGSKYSSGESGGEIYRGAEFTLRQGIVVAEIVHHGQGSFKLTFVPSEGFQRARNQEHRVIGRFVRLPRVGGAAEWASNRIVPLREWPAAENSGPLHAFSATRVDEDGDGRIAPGEYRLEVESQGDWSCRFIQPDLGQSISPLDQVDMEVDDQSSSSVVGPHMSGARPTLASVRHHGMGHFKANAYSVDGTHQCVIHEGRGQFSVQDLQTEVRPGKEYLVLVNSDNRWNLTFSEGY